MGAYLTSNVRSDPPKLATTIWWIIATLRHESCRTVSNNIDMTDNHPEKILIIVPIFSGAIKFPWGNCPIFLFYFVPMVVGRSQDTILDGRGLIPGKRGGGGGE